MYLNKRGKASKLCKQKARICIYSAQTKNRNCPTHKKRIPTLSADSGIVLDNSRIVQWRCIVLWSDNGVCAN